MAISVNRFIIPSGQIDIVKTFECGQCFRWNADTSGIYFGIAAGYPAKIYPSYDGICVESEAPDAFWEYYFDLKTDYENAARTFSGLEYMDRCAEYGKGIRILKQDPWETLCSFIISQCNNIPRIKKIVETLCSQFGDKVIFDDKIFRTFPNAEKIALLEQDDLSILHSGYRAEYILNAAKAVAGNDIDLAALKDCSWQNAERRLMELRGVGKKVADCVLLFGLGHMEAFPVDVWIRRAIKENFPPDFDPSVLGEYAGLAQQYIFYYSRSIAKL